MQTSEVLNKAADHIQEHGHHKGDAFNGSDLRTASMCTVGVITYVCIKAGDKETALAARAAVTEHLGGGLIRWNDEVTEHLGGGLIRWNDAPERTAAEVIEVLRAAALIEQAREAATENAETRQAVGA